MKKVFIFSKKKSWFSTQPDLNLLNQQLEKLQNQGLVVDSITPAITLFGAIDSFIIVLSDQGEA
ncbi:hypothetical protein [Pseudoalteromonas sp. MMG005]|uniref:hypothetical protein n=1 Tax=Pseudoalteromonas sp. MMG005 TaxID=2822682 RepID=UPI001B3A2B49|nr:hypothetical protein [Pseudoalteromonas sp. MMG005]MBQ4846907.1 hypothetical protein [Pseudoalteromonas sp. MMG005]